MCKKIARGSRHTGGTLRVCDQGGIRGYRAPREDGLVFVRDQG